MRAGAEPRGWFRQAAAIVGAITLARVVALGFNGMDLFVDEAQYWFWGQEPAFGYYSKPPLIGWLIRAVTDLAGSDAPFWVRLPGPFLHAATALILGAVAARRGAGVLVAAGYATLPMVAVGSILISTDTVMFPFLAAALAGYLACLDRRRTLGGAGGPGGGLALAAATGLALGLAFMAKYAAIYYLACALLAAVLIPSARPGWRAAGTILAVFGLTISPNIVWNLQHGLTTLQHTADNADWVRAPGALAGLNLRGLATFVLSQFAVFGPVLFAGLLWMGATPRGRGAPAQLLLLFSLPIVALIAVQAALSGAYANWAAAAYLAGSVAVLPWLARVSRPLVLASFAVNGALCVALPLAALAPAQIRLGDAPPLLERYTGIDEMTRRILAVAEKRDVATVVASDRDILADLFYTGRDAPFAFAARPEPGRPAHHYALTHTLSGVAPGPILLVTRDGPPGCAGGAAPAATLRPETGTYRGTVWRLYVLAADCWSG